MKTCEKKDMGHSDRLNVDKERNHVCKERDPQHIDEMVGESI